MRFLSIQQFGGVLMFIFCLLGAYGLWQKKRELFYLLALWIGGVLYLLSIDVFSARSHMMDMNFALVVLMSYGVFLALQAIKDKSGRWGNWLGGILLLLIVFNLVASTKLWINEIYAINPTPQDNAYSQAVKAAGVKDDEVIAFGGDSYKLNYLTGKSFATFREATLQALADSGTAGDALAKFNVKYVLGYSPALTGKLTASSSVINIADSSIDVGSINKKSKRELLKIFR